MVQLEGFWSLSLVEDAEDKVVAVVMLESLDLVRRGLFREELLVRLGLLGEEFFFLLLLFLDDEDEEVVAELDDLCLLGEELLFLLLGDELLLLFFLFSLLLLVATGVGSLKCPVSQKTR